MPDMIITTRRLRLEPLAPCHGPALESFARLWEVARYTASIPHPYPSGGGIAYAAAISHGLRHGGDPIWAVIEKRSSAAIGTAGLYLSQDRRRAELGYMYAPWAWGRGYATEASRALIETAFTALDVDLVFSHAVVENRASCRVLAKAGLWRIGNDYYGASARGHEVIAETYRLTRQEWQS